MINSDIKTECQENRIWELMAEIDRLNKENEQLKIENIQIKAEKDEWKDGFKLLHNSIEQKYEENSQEEDLSYIDEYAKGNSEWDNYSLPEDLDWKMAQ